MTPHVVFIVATFSQCLFVPVTKTDVLWDFDSSVLRPNMWGVIAFWFLTLTIFYVFLSYFLKKSIQTTWRETRVLLCSYIFSIEMFVQSHGLYLNQYWCCFDTGLNRFYLLWSYKQCLVFRQAAPWLIHILLIFYSALSVILIFAVCCAESLRFDIRFDFPLNLFWLLLSSLQYDYQKTTAKINAIRHFFQEFHCSGLRFMSLKHFELFYLWCNCPFSLFIADNWGNWL